MRLILLITGTALILATVLSTLRSAIWWIRSTDFPRLQIAAALAFVLGVYLWQNGVMNSIDVIFVVACASALGYQLYRILPYTPLYSRQVVSRRHNAEGASIRLLISNVLMDNRQADRFLEVVHQVNPDLILAVETDDWWDEHLEVLDREYPHSIKQPQDNTYGMHLFSKLELRQPEVRFLIQTDVPSVCAMVHLASGDWIQFFGLHPRPPKPEQDTEQRDAEILVVAKEVEAEGRAAIVAGDLNDVAWSHTTRLFQRISGTLDPRRGRGMYSTFHAKYPFFRWPLDHVFVEPSFTLVRLERLRSIGSDHFPIMAEVQYEPCSATRQEAPKPDAADHREAREKIAEGSIAGDLKRLVFGPSGLPQNLVAPKLVLNHQSRKSLRCPASARPQSPAAASIRDP